MRKVTTATLLLLSTLVGCDQDNTSASSAGVSSSGGTSAKDAGETLATVNGLTVGSTEFEAPLGKKPDEADATPDICCGQPQ